MISSCHLKSLLRNIVFYQELRNNKQRAVKWLVKIWCLCPSVHTIINLLFVVSALLFVPHCIPKSTFNSFFVRSSDAGGCSVVLLCPKHFFFYCYSTLPQHVAWAANIYVVLRTFKPLMMKPVFRSRAQTQWRSQYQIILNAGWQGYSIGRHFFTAVFDFFYNYCHPKCNGLLNLYFCSIINSFPNIKSNICIKKLLSTYLLKLYQSSMSMC